MSEDNSEQQLNILRNEIDSIDKQIHQLINKRAGLAQDVADVKMAAATQAGEQQPVFYRPEREAQVLRAVMERNQGPLHDSDVAHIFREIMSACLALEKPLTVAYLGPRGTFSEAAALKHFGNSAVTEPCATVPEIFASVEKGLSEYGVVPVENSTEGVVAHTLDCFVHSPLKVCGELFLPIQHNLLIAPSASIDTIVKVCGHQQALAQCRDWLRKHLPNVEQVEVSSNGEAARLASEDSSIAAVAGLLAAEQYSLNTAASDVQDMASNMTRFLVVANEAIPPSGHDKTTIIVSVKNRPGSLYELIKPLAEAGVSLTRIESRPSKTENWAYLFFLEFEGHCTDDKVKPVLENLESQSHSLKVLGSYPAAVF